MNIYIIETKAVAGTCVFNEMCTGISQRLRDQYFGMLQMSFEIQLFYS